MSDKLPYIIRPNPADPRLTERVRGIDQTGAPIETSVTVERALTIFLNSQEIVTAMTINDYPEYLAIGYLLNQNMLLQDDEVTGVDDVLAEWNDRYGPPPAPAAVLLDVARLRAECLRLGITAVSVQKGRARLDGWELRKSQEARLKQLSDKSQVLPGAVVVPVAATSDVSLPQALLKLLSLIAPAESAPVRSTG